jgi:hypothetical protein
VTTITAFRKAARSGATSDLYDLREIMRQADTSLGQIASIAASPRLDTGGIAGHHQSVEQRKASQLRLSANIMQMVSRTHDHASGWRNTVRACCAAPDLSPGGQERRNQELRRFSDTLLVMTDDVVVDEAGRLIASMNAATYDLAGVVAEELRRRRLDALAEDVLDAIHVARSAFLTDERYLTACDLTTRASAWLAAVDPDDPTLTIIDNGVELTARVSELLEPEPVAPAPKQTTRKAATPTAPKTPGPGMIDHFVAGPPLKR